MMRRYEYKVVPAPQKGEKAKGVRSPEARFALAVEHAMNELAEEGWEYLRADLLPSAERQGLTGTVTQWRNLLVFRRLKASEADTLAPKLLEPPEPDVDAPAEPRSDTRPVWKDNGVEEPGELEGMTNALRVRAAQTLTGDAPPSEAQDKSIFESADKTTHVVGYDADEAAHHDGKDDRAKT